MRTPDEIRYVKPTAARAQLDPETLRSQYLGIFAAVYHIRPWEWDLLDWGDVLDLVDAYHRTVKED